MSQSLLLPAVVIAGGVALVACFAAPLQRVAWGRPTVSGAPAAETSEDVIAGS